LPRGSRKPTITRMTGEELRKLAEIRDRCSSGEARRLRRRLQISLSEIAGAVPTSETNVYRWETGERMPRGELALRYGAVLEELERGDS